MLFANPSHKRCCRFDIIADHAQMLFGGNGQAEERPHRLWQRVEILSSLNGLIPEKFDETVGLYMLAMCTSEKVTDSSLTAA
jgi:hypothetical protein